MGDQTDERFASNLRTARERAGMSQKDMADAMTELGYPMPQQTIARIENGQRVVRGPGELLALTRAVRLRSLDSLLRPEGMRDRAYHLLEATTRVRDCRKAMAEYPGAVKNLRRLIEAAERDGVVADLDYEIGVARYALRQEDPDGAH